MPPAIGIVGIGSSGKTTYTAKLVSELKSRGYRVATVKHAPSGMDLAEKGKDSWFHLQAGSEATAVSTPDRVVLTRLVSREMTAEEVVRLIGEDYDIVLVEGFKQGDLPKIEVHRKSVGPPLTGLTRLIGIATDEKLDTEARQFPLDDVREVADLIEKGFIIPGQERITMQVNGAPVVLTSYPKEVISKVIVALAESLKGVGEVKSIDISLRRGGRASGGQ